MSLRAERRKTRATPNLEFGQDIRETDMDETPSAEIPSADYRKAPAHIAADILLEIEAVHIRPDDPSPSPRGA